MDRFNRKKLYASALSCFIPLNRIYDSKKNSLINYNIKQLRIYNSYSIDNLNEFILQGICIVDNYILLTAYDENHNNNSIVYVLNNYKIVNICELYNNAHVGGIAYDSNHDLIWITDKKGTISSYNKSDILKNKSAEPIFKRIDVSSGLVNVYGNLACAYICINNDKLYVGNYANKKPILKEYPIEKDGTINLNEEKNYLFCKYVQGITFLNINNDTYLLISSSRGRIINSIISIYHFNENNFNIYDNKRIILNLPPMIEQITINDNNELLVVFESNAKKYQRTAGTKTDDLVLLDISNIIKNISLLK